MKKGAKALIDNRLEDKLSKGTKILMKQLNSYDKSKIDLFSFFKNEVSKLSLGNLEHDDSNLNYLRLLTPFRLPNTSSFLNNSLLKLT